MSNIINKVVYGGQVLIDLTADTVTEEKVLTGQTFHKADGTIGTGSCTFDADTSDATAQAAEVLADKSFYKNGAKMTGSMPNIGEQDAVITTVDQVVNIQNGYHDGSGSIAIDTTEQAKLIASNIKSGVEILGVTGDYTGAELIRATTSTATPKTTQQVILPSEIGEYDYFTQLTIAPIPYTEALNSAGGYTVTIAG